jgi:hypothetical protein
MFLAFLEDVDAFTRELGGEATFTRLAVTPEQIPNLGLPTAPPKDRQVGLQRRDVPGQSDRT